MAKPKTTAESNFDKSFASYKRQWKEWAGKGYAMDERMNKKEYRQAYKLAVDAGEKNIARSFAHSDIKFTATEARKFTKSLGETKIIKERVYDPAGKYSDAKGQRYNLETTEFKFSKEELAEIKKEFSFKNLIQMDPGELFNRLREEYGLSAREAGSVVDEIYKDGRR